MKKVSSYSQAYNEWQWIIPQHFNMGVSICDAQNQSATALIVPQINGAQLEYSFGDLRKESSKLVNLLLANGLSQGDRVAILLPQKAETLIAHIASYRANFIAMPLAQLFGPDALEHRLTDSKASVVITDQAGCKKIDQVKHPLPDLKLILSLDGKTECGLHDVQDFYAEMARARDFFDPVVTKSSDPALLIYTSGTTGNPKGALLPHRTMIGHIPGADFIFDFLPQSGDVMWTPADWAWIGALMDSAMPALYHGIPQVVNPPGRFDPEKAFDLMDRYGVRNAFIPPTALKIMRQVNEPRKLWRYNLRSMFSGGEALGTSLINWGREQLGVTINEAYGQTECNLIVGCCSSVMTPPDGSMGRAIPGHELKILDKIGNTLPAGELGNICVKSPDPVMFLKYWNNPEATKEKFITDSKGDQWLNTGDKARIDENGWLFFIGRADDVINSAGFRIGPAEVENSLLTHPAISMSAVIGIPDELRGELVKAYIVLKDKKMASDKLITEIQNHVKQRLSAHEFPRAIEFVDELPMTTTGKIQRRLLRKRNKH
jgi:acetyl-CoA synthetase